MFVKKKSLLILYIFLSMCISIILSERFGITYKTWEFWVIQSFIGVIEYALFFTDDD